MVDRLSVLRSKPITNSKLSEETPLLNEKSQPGNDKPLSKAALKNQRKYEAEKVPKQEARKDKNQDLAPTLAHRADPERGHLHSHLETDEKFKNQRPESN